MADAELLVGHPEDDLGGDGIAGQPERMNLGTIEPGTSGFDHALRLLQGYRQLRGADMSEARCEFAHGAAGCVLFAIVCVIDDLPMVNLAGCHLGKFLQQDDG